MLVLVFFFSEICPEDMEKVSVTLTSDHMENSPVYIDDPKNINIELTNPTSSGAPVVVEVSVKEHNTSAAEFYTVTTEVENAANVKWTLMSEEGTPIETIEVRLGINSAFWVTCFCCHLLSYYPATKSEGYTFGVFRPHFLSVRNHISVPIRQI